MVNYPLDPKLKKFCRFVVKRLENDYDYKIAISGRTGTGKSMGVAIPIAREIDPDFDLERNVAYVPEAGEIQSKFYAINPKGVLLVDEAIRGLHKHNWANYVQQVVVKMYNTERYQNKATILIMPRFKDFTEGFRNNLIDVWIHVLERGRAVAFIRDDDKDAEDPWHIKENEKIKDRMFRRRSVLGVGTEDLINAEKKTKNFFFDFNFPDLDETSKERYTALKLASRKAIDYGVEEKENKNVQAISIQLKKYANVTYNLLREKGLVQCPDDYAKLLQESERNLKTRIEQGKRHIAKEMQVERSKEYDKAMEQFKNPVLLPGIMVPTLNTGYSSENSIKDYEVVGKTTPKEGVSDKQ